MAFLLPVKFILRISQLLCWGQKPVAIMQTCPGNEHPLTRLTPHFYIVKLGCTGVYIFFLIFALKHRLWVLVKTASLRQF